MFYQPPWSPPKTPLNRPPSPKPEKSIRFALRRLSATSSISITVGKGDAGVSFEVELPAGETYLNGYFVRADGSKIGSYYADVEKL